MICRRMDLRLLCTSTLLASLLAAQRVTEGPEPNASAVTATGVACGNEAVGALSTTSDEDWYRVVLSTASDLVLVTSPGSGVGCRDTVVTLLDGSGGPLRLSDAAAQSGWYSELSARALPPGLYYVAVTAGANAVPGSYQLDISCLPRAATSTPGAGASARCRETSEGFRLAQAEITYARQRRRLRNTRLPVVDRIRAFHSCVSCFSFHSSSLHFYMAVHPLPLLVPHLPFLLLYVFKY